MLRIRPLRGEHAGDVECAGRGARGREDEAGSARRHGDTHRLRSRVIVLERDIAKAARAAAVVGDECISDLAIDLEGAPQKLRARRGKVQAEIKQACDGVRRLG
jgi:hypothetical protein